MNGNTNLKRAWKLQEFVAHGSSVNCLALGHKSGRVLVTGGEDKKVNLWAVGKPSCIMSLCGHTTPIECVRFGHTEELVCAGSQSGALKIWDLEAARLVRTLTGHKSSLTCIDFHPYGDFLATGSSDTNLKLWDIRRKGCIFTYKGHSHCVNSLKFSPDGQWIASGGEEGAVKIWDLRAGKLMTEFHDHGGPVYDVEFHPHEFLLASASADRTVNFLDLESFQLVSKSEKDNGPVRCIQFHPESDCVFSGAADSFKVHLWEPHRICDSIPLNWGKVRDIAVASSQLIGASYSMSNVSIYVIDLKRVQPFGLNTKNASAVTSSLKQGQPSSSSSNHTISADPMAPQRIAEDKPLRTESARRAFNKGQKPGGQVMREEKSSDKSGTDEQDVDDSAEDAASQADITDYRSYEAIFRPRQRLLSRTPPLSGEDEGSSTSFPAPPETEPTPTTTSASASSSAGLRTTLRLSSNNSKKAASNNARANINARHQRNSLSSKSKASRYASTPDLSSGGSSGSGSPPSSSSSSTNGLSSSQGGYSTLSGRARLRKNSRPNTPPENNGRSISSRTSAGPSPRPVSVYGDAGGSGHSPPTNQSPSDRRRNLRAASVQPRSAHELNVDASIRDLSSGFSQLNPVSRIQIGAAEGPPSSSRPLDRPALVRPQRTSLQHEPMSPTPASSQQQPQQFYQQQQQPDVQFYESAAPRPEYLHQQPPAQYRPSGASPMRSTRYSQPNLTSTSSYGSFEQDSLMCGKDVDSSKEPMNQVIPMNADKPSGLKMSDFLPSSAKSSSSNSMMMSNSSSSRFSAYSQFDNGPQSEVEVAESIAGGHNAMMTALTSRGRQVEIIHKLWQNKDAKTAVDHAVSLNDSAVLVDFLSIIVLRPSIWNLDLCSALLPPIGDLLQSKFEMYINVGCGAMKLILKNFASVIKTNIDSPIQTVGVDISREERHNKCMQCYKDLVKIRALILKRQNTPGKLGHSYRELSILMQYLD